MEENNYFDDTTAPLGWIYTIVGLAVVASLLIWG